MPCFLHDGISFHYAESGSGRAFLFSHGLGGDSSRAAELTAELPGLRVILYDNRGHGRSRPLVDPSRLSFAAMADDMAALLDHLAIPRAVVGGVSMGAGVALAFGLRHKARAHALVLSRPAWLDQPNPPNLEFAPLLAGLIETAGPARALAEFERTPYFSNLRARHPEAAETLREVFTLAEPRALAACYGAMAADRPMESLATLRALDVPCLVLGNDDDPFHPFEFAQAWAAALPRAQFGVLPSRAEDPVAHVAGFRRAVTEFLASVVPEEGR